MTYQNRHFHHPAVIADGATTSAAVDVSQQTIVGFRFPSGFSGTSITVQESPSPAGTYQTVIDPTTGADVTIAAAASKTVTIAPQALACVQYIRIVSNATEVGGDTVTIITRPVA
jgi:hypothetical protein